MTAGYLIHAGVKPTPARILVMKTLLDSSTPLSAQDIEMRIDTLDHSTISRTLPVLADAHLIHVISDGSGSMKYEACHDCNNTEGHHHSDQHAHFHCRRCGKTICLPEIGIEIPRLQDGYEAENMTLVITGLCPACSGRD